MLLGREELWLLRRPMGRFQVVTAARFQVVTAEHLAVVAGVVLPGQTSFVQLRELIRSREMTNN